MTRVLTVFTLFLALVLLTACSSEKAANNAQNKWGEPTPAEKDAQIANPASTYCIDHGGKLEIRTDAAGAQSGVCVLAGGKECEEWAYMRGECKA